MEKRTIWEVLKYTSSCHPSRLEEGASMTKLGLIMRFLKGTQKTKVHKRIDPPKGATSLFSKTLANLYPHLRRYVGGGEMTLSCYNDFAPARNAHPSESPKSFHRFRNPQISRDRQYRRRLDPGEDKRGRARQTRDAGGRGGVRQKLQVQRDTSRD